MVKIVLYGAESTGKTTLAKALAEHYQTSWVPEYARTFLQQKMDRTGAVCAYEDLLPIAKGQLKDEEKRASETAKNLLICDTNILQTYYYGKAYFKSFEHRALWHLIENNHYDFYFLTDIDIPWVPDDLRDRPNQRCTMHQFFKSSLDDNNIPYMLLSGPFADRMRKAVQKIDELSQKIYR